MLENSPYETLDYIDVSSICHLYKTQLNIDVSRFFKDLKNVEIRKCKDSNLKYYYPTSIQGDAEFYDELSRVIPYYSNRLWQFNYAKMFIEKNDKVLDIGCGSAVFLESLKPITDNLNGIEFNPKAIEVCKQKNINVYEGDLKELGDVYNEKFDVITSFQVLEHVSEVFSFIENAIKLLKPKGKFIIAVPNNNPYLYKYDKMHTLNLPPHHLGLWDKSALSYLPNIFDLNVVKIAIEPLDNFSHWLRIQLHHYVGLNPLPNSKLINAILNRAGRLIRNRIEGRNIIGIYEKR